MERFLNAVKSHAGALDRAQGQPRFAVVASIDPVHYAARVTLQPEGVLSGWLPVLSPWVGNGWGIACLPAPGDQVLVLPQEGAAEHGVIAASSFSDRIRPPTATPGELLLQHRSGTSLRLANDGTVRIQGDLHVSGDVYDHHGKLDGLRGHYNLHRHPGSLGDKPDLQD
jgi:phage baseplate assembly protein gpV